MHRLAKIAADASLPLSLKCCITEKYSEALKTVDGLQIIMPAFCENECRRRRGNSGRLRTYAKQQSFCIPESQDACLYPIVLLPLTITMIIADIAVKTNAGSDSQIPPRHLRLLISQIPPRHLRLRDEHPTTLCEPDHGNGTGNAHWRNWRHLLSGRHFVGGLSLISALQFYSP